MAIWTGKAIFIDPHQRVGHSEWAVEAFDETLATEMVRQALSRDGLTLQNATLSEMPPNAPRAAHFATVGVVAAIQEGARDWGTSHSAARIEPRALARDDGSEDAPFWISPALWDALFAPKDHARVYAVVDGMVWEAAVGQPMSQSLQGSDMQGVSLYEDGAGQDNIDAGPWLVDISLAPGAEENPGVIRATLFQNTGAPNTGLFLRDAANLQDMRARLRKLTKVKDIDDSWYFNRFWEPEFFLYFTLFLEGRSMLAPLAGVSRYAMVIDDGVVVADTDFSPSIHAQSDREAELDRLFEAGAAMVCLRRARTLEAQHQREIDPDDVYDLVQNLFGLDGMDYRFVERLADIAYVLRNFYAADAHQALPDSLIDGCFDEDGRITRQIDFVHGLCMFGLLQNVPPASLPHTGVY